MKRLSILIIISTLISTAFALTVLTHANFYDLNTEKYVYDTNIVIKNSGDYSLSKSLPKGDFDSISLNGGYVFPGFFLSYINAIDYPYLDLWSFSGVTAAFSYSKYYYMLSRIASKDSATLINKNLMILHYRTNACNILTSELVFDKKELNEQYIQYSIFLHSPKIITVKHDSIRYLPTIMKSARYQNIKVIVEIKDLNDFKQAVRFGCNLIIGVPTKKINFDFPKTTYVVSNLNQIKLIFGKDSSQYKNALYNIKLLHNNGNKILFGKFDKIGLPLEEIRILKNILTHKEIILGLTKYAYDAFGYKNKRDLVIFKEDPLKKINNLNSMYLVIKNGQFANIARGSINYSRKENYELSTMIDNTSLYLCTSIYPVLSLERKMFGIGNNICIPKIKTNIYADTFLSSGWSIGYDFGISYKNYFYNYTYILNKYEKRSLSAKEKGFEIGYYGEYVLKNPFPYPKYDSGLFENLYLKTNNLNILLGFNRANTMPYCKFQYSLVRETNEKVKIFMGISTSPYYQYKVNLGKIVFFNNYEKTSHYVASVDISNYLINLKNIVSIQSGGGIMLYDDQLDLYIYGKMSIANSLSLLLMHDLNEFRAKIAFENNF